MPLSRNSLSARLKLLGASILASMALALPASAQDSDGAQYPRETSGPIQLRPTQAARKAATPPSPQTAVALPASPPAAVPASEFERYAQRVSGTPELRRFGHDLASRLKGDAEDDYHPSIPPDYLVRAGDELVVTLWGSVDADLRLTVDRSGRVTIPRVGPILVSGVRYAELADVISRRVAQVFRNFQVSVSLGQLRGMRVYVTGFANTPGPVVVNSLTTATQALLAAGGPAAAGSFRDIQLRRGKKTVARLDLYDLLLSGDRSSDIPLQPEDVIHVGPVGAQVAAVGSVNRPAIFELRAGETVEDALRMAGGFTAVADAGRLSLERLELGETARLRQLRLPEARGLALMNGDVLRAFTYGDLARPTEIEPKRVRVEGEVARPGEYVLPATSTVADAIRAAGGLTANSYLYGTEFTRESVRRTQEINYERALRDLETSIATQNATRRTSTAEEATSLSATTVATNRWLEQLRQLKPTGRVVLNVEPKTTELPALVLETGDRIFIPARPTTVGVFGSVFSTGNYLYGNHRKLGDYLRLAGGPRKGADETSVFVVRANGTVASSLQQAGWFSRGNTLEGSDVEPGDTIFVPEEMDKSTWVQNAKDWTQILYQFGIGIAGIVSATR